MHTVFLTAPGGYFYARDIDLVIYSSNEPPFPPAEGEDHDYGAILQSCNLYNKINAVYAGNALRRNLITG